MSSASSNEPAPTSAKPDPAATAARLVRRWEDCLAPYDLPRWAEEAALTLRTLAAQHLDGHPVVRLAMAVAAVRDEHDRHADAAAAAPTEAERKRLEGLADATCPRMDTAVDALVAACRQLASNNPICG